LADAPTVVASCFKYPFSKVSESSQGDYPKRNIILVGHDTKQDVSYLRKLGYDVYNLSNLMEEVDTATLWRYLTRDTNPRSLGVILAELGIIGWNLHNAGNDAAYTLQAMIGIAVKAIVDKQRGREVLEEEKAERIASCVGVSPHRVLANMSIVLRRRQKL
jgi:DNA polymerase III alpha subunit (gram-positive type)